MDPIAVIGKSPINLKIFQVLNPLLANKNFTLLPLFYLLFHQNVTKESPNNSFVDDIIAHLDFHHRMVLFEQIFCLHSQQSLKKYTGLANGNRSFIV